MPNEATVLSDEDRRREVLRRRLTRKLAGFTAEIPEENAKAPTTSYQPARDRFPVPELVLFALRDVLGWRWLGPWEKTRWTVYGAVDGRRVAFELRKFGFTIHIQKDRPELGARVEGQLRQALRDVEAYLRPFAKAQVERGEAMIINRFMEFDQRYRFHRSLADAAYQRGSGVTPPPEPHLPDDERERIEVVSTDITARINASWSANRQGFFHSTAMIDAYFSCLEHRLVLLRAFTGRAFAEKEVLDLLSMGWDDKLKLILPRPLPREAGDLLGRMRRIKERIRNPFAHGGVENDQGSIFFKLPKIGAVPANFTRFGDSVRFTVLPVNADDHADSCSVFDALDTLLASGDLAGPDQFIRGGVDPVFDALHTGEYAEALAGGSTAVEAYIDAWSSSWEQHVNMDY
ncbi:MAG: hypothetical protein J7483_08805 [Novosphingobium sp.]|nr:hypothetical protein [Novosphingobium sp.]